ncbi:AAA family ATPase [Kineococcus sp. TBRC 1896]|uniref:AAA family ATPase n=1 Tax=Kineococcus mangrovi TaxID=1660183 RepID=A0ABV4HXQ6_9ACTN
MSTGGHRPVRGFVPRSGTVLDPETWPDRVPAIRQLLTSGLDLPGGVTFLVGANGAGKSTVVEALAGALGAHVEGGTGDHHGGPDRGRRTDGSSLADRLQVVRGPGGRRETFFLRAETMHRFYDYLEQSDVEATVKVGYQYHYRSHGEGFLDLLASRYVARAGVVLLDEPESALSFENCLVAARSLADLARRGKQVVCATHSPVLTAVPGARVLEVDERGMTSTTWEDLRLVHDWRFFLDAPERYLRDGR